MDARINYSGMDTKTLETIRDNVDRSKSAGEIVYKKVMEELDYRDALMELLIELDRLINSLNIFD